MKTNKNMNNGHTKINLKAKLRKNIRGVAVLIIISIIISFVGYYVFYKKIHANKVNDKISKIQIEEEQEKLEKELKMQNKIDVNTVINQIKKKAKNNQTDKKDKEEFKIIYVYEKETEKLPNIQIKNTDIMINNLSLQLLGNKISNFDTKIYIYTNEYKLSQNVYQTLKYAGYTNVWIITGFEYIEKENINEVIRTK